MSWWENIREWANNLGPLANVFGIVGISVTSVLVSFFGLMWPRLRRQEVIRDNLKKNLRLQDEEIEDLKREIDTLRQYDPHSWLEQAERERKDGNEEKAIVALRSGVMRTSKALHETYLTLARHHVAIYPDQGESLHLQEAERLSQIAALLKPDDKAATWLLEEISETIAMENIHRGYYNPHDLYEGTAITGLYGSEWGEEVIIQLLSIARNHYEAGRYIFFERLTHRARSIGLRELGENSKITCRARNRWAFSLYLNSQYFVAKTETEELLFIEKRVLGPHHPSTLATCYLHAQILDSLGRDQEALNKVEELLPLMERVNGTKHPDTLSTRHLHTQILNSLRQHQEALNKAEELLPLMESVQGARHPHTLPTRYLHAEILDNLGQHQGALDKIEALLPIEESVRGEQHPSTLSTRHLHAEILSNLGRNEDALKETEYLLPLMERVRGAEHPDTLKTFSLRREILEKLKGQDVKV